MHVRSFSTNILTKRFALNMEKQLSSYHNDKYCNEANVAIEHMNFMRPTEGKYTKWFRRISGKVILVILLMGVFIVAQAFRLPGK